MLKKFFRFSSLISVFFPAKYEIRNPKLGCFQSYPKGCELGLRDSELGLLSFRDTKILEIFSKLRNLNL